VNDRFLIEVIHGGDDTILEFDADVAQHRARPFEKQPSMRLSREPCVEGEWEGAERLGESGVGLLGDVHGMIVEDQLDRRVSCISGLEELEKFDEFAATMAVPNEGLPPAGGQINTGRQTESALALIFMIPCEGRVHDGLGWQVRHRDCLNAWLLIRDDHRGIARHL
jgi:hypothetical protein